MSKAFPGSVCDNVDKRNYIKYDTASSLAMIPQNGRLLFHSDTLNNILKQLFTISQWTIFPIDGSGIQEKRQTELEGM